MKPYPFLLASGVIALAARYLRCTFRLVLLAGCLITSGIVRAESKPNPQAVMMPPGAPASPVAAEKLSNNLPAWTVGCFSVARSAAPDCKIEQRLFVRETGRMLSIAVIDIPGATRQPQLLMHLPNGLALQAGVSLSIDNGTATPLQWESCDGNGCYATLKLTPAQIEAMKKGKVMTVRASAANREPLLFQHLLTDFTAAFDAAQ